MLLTLRFKANLIRLVMSCVRMAFFSVLINWVPKGYIKPSRGIRQANPLSPYLFLLCTKILVRLLQQVASRNLVNGIILCKGATNISHHLFVNDSVMFYKVEVGTNQRVQKLL